MKLTFMICTDLGGTEPALGRTVIGLSPQYLILNSPALEPWLNKGTSLAMTLLLATTLPKSTGPSISNFGCDGYLIK